MYHAFWVGVPLLKTQTRGLRPPISQDEFEYKIDLFELSERDKIFRKKFRENVLLNHFSKVFQRDCQFHFRQFR